MKVVFNQVSIHLSNYILQLLFWQGEQNLPQWLQRQNWSHLVIKSCRYSYRKCDSKNNPPGKWWRGDDERQARWGRSGGDWDQTKETRKMSRNRWCGRAVDGGTTEQRFLTTGKEWQERPVSIAGRWWPCAAGVDEPVAMSHDHKPVLEKSTNQREQHREREKPQLFLFNCQQKLVGIVHAVSILK